MWVDKRYGDEYECEDDVWETISMEMGWYDILEHADITPEEMLRELVRMGSPLAEDIILEAQDAFFQKYFEEVEEEEENGD